MLKQFSLSIVNISGIVTEGALETVAKIEGRRVILIEDDAVATQNSHLMKFHAWHSASRKFTHKSFKNG